jgi:hypothetical protein
MFRRRPGAPAQDPYSVAPPSPGHAVFDAEQIVPDAWEVESAEQHGLTDAALQAVLEETDLMGPAAVRSLAREVESGGAPTVAFGTFRVLCAFRILPPQSDTSTLASLSRAPDIGTDRAQPSHSAYALLPSLPHDPDRFG